MQIIKRSSAKTFMIVIEGYFIFLMALIIGWLLVGPVISNYLINVPLVTISMSSTTIIPAIVASFYLWKRSGTGLKTTGVDNILKVVPFLILAWITVYISVLFLGNHDSLANQISIIENNIYFCLTIFILTVLQPIVCEVFFRGFIFEVLRKNFNVLVSILMTSVLLTLLSSIYGGIRQELISIFLYSIVITVAYIQCGLVGSSLVHCFINSYLISIFLSSYPK